MSSIEVASTTEVRGMLAKAPAFEDARNLVDHASRSKRDPLRRERQFVRTDDDGSEAAG
jgi:hypothetical protein